MATYTDVVGNVYTHDDDKLGFDAWIRDDTTRFQEWITAAAAHENWQKANPTAHPSEANDRANAIFDEWIEYANVQRPTSE